MQAIIYILHFKNSDRYYIGSTTDLERRIKQHKAGYTPSTKRLGSDFELVFSQIVKDLPAARKAERRIKSWKRRDFVKKIVADGKISFLNQGD